MYAGFLRKFGFGIIFLFLYLGSHAQVQLKVLVTGMKSKTPAYVTTYSEKDKKTVPVTNGKANVELLRYQQYVVIVYQKGRKPFVFSIDTEKASRILGVKAVLANGNVSTIDYSPKKHYSVANGRFGPIDFDLDLVKHKAAFASQMQEASEEIRTYFKTNRLPIIQKKQKGYQNDDSFKKTEHQIGQEIYKLLGKKRALELDLERINQEGVQAVYPDASIQAKHSACEKNLFILRREKQYYEMSYKLARAELEKMELSINKQIKKGESINQNSLDKRRKKSASAKMEFEAAELNYKNKKIECWELSLRADIDNSYDEVEKNILEIEINNIKLYQRKQNAIRLYKLHNKLAMDVTERDRLVELAKAQKNVSDHAKARLEINRNKITKLQLDARGSKANDRKIKAAYKEFEKNEELAFQAEMGYLEHMWNLRNRDDLKGDRSSDLFARQSQLLDIEILPPRVKPMDFVENFDPTASLTQQFEQLFDAYLKASSKSDERGEVVEVKTPDDLYEIVIDSKGIKSYFKNGKPITALTYRFETVKKYGEFLNNIRIEEKKKKKFLDMFRKRTNY